ncbi:MAG: GGDEF domain-containing protein [Acidimicrobiales bacterium]
MAAGDTTAGIAFSPIMDLSDGRVIAYDTSPRFSGTRPTAAALLDAALSEAASAGSAPFLVHVEPSLLLESDFDPLSHVRAAKCSPSEVVLMLPGLPGDRTEAIERRRHCARSLREEGYRVGIEGVGPLSVSWEEVADTRPAFLLMEANTTEQLHKDAAKAALAGLLAFVGRLGGRLVAQGVSNAIDAKALVAVGVFYGSGSHLHGPVVLDSRLAQEGDLIVRPSWFKEQAVRKLSAGLDGNIHLVRTAPTPEVAEDHRLAELLTEWSGTLSSAGDPEAVLTALADIVPQLVPCDRLAVFEADWDRYVLRAKVLVGESTQGLADVTYTLNAGITGWAFLRGQPYRCGRTADHPEAAPIPGEGDIEESLLVIPLISGNQRLGVLDIWRDGSDQFSEGDLQRATLLAKLAADAWRSAKQRVELAERVVTDTLTGLLNKRWWHELAPREAAQAIRTKSSIAVLLVDLDNFKGINDSFGHAGGDLVLKQVARTLSESVRSGDAVIRFGGDEFVLLLRDCGEQGALEVANELQLKLSRTGGRVGEGAVTASIGVALFPQHGLSLEDVAMHADTAMYRAKSRGRDQTAFYSQIADDSSDVSMDAPVIEELTIDSILDASTGPRPSLRQQIRQELEQEYRHLVDAQQLSRVGSFEMDLETGILEWSVELRRILGAPMDEEPSIAKMVDRVHPDDRSIHAERLREWANSGRHLLQFEVRIVRPDAEVNRVLFTQLVREPQDGRHILIGTLQELAACPADPFESERARLVP